MSLIVTLPEPIAHGYSQGTVRIPICPCMSSPIHTPIFFAALSCVLTVGLAVPVHALPVAPPATAPTGFDALLSQVAPGGSPTDTRTQGFRLDVDRPLRDLGMTAAHGSNAAGWTVGEGPVDGGSHAILWVDGAEPRDLGDLPGGAIAAVARAGQRGRTGGRARAPPKTETVPSSGPKRAGMRDLTLLAEAGAGHDPA